MINEDDKNYIQVIFLTIKIFNMKSEKISVKKTLFILFAVTFSIVCVGQNNKLYNPVIDAKKQIEEAVAKAKQENKHVLLQIGGNWCSWCIMLHKFYNSHEKVDSILKSDYILEYVNYSKENKNLDLLQKLGFPQRFGFPVLVILDAEGNRIHTQNSVYLEEGRGYNEKKVVDFLNAWKPSVLDPENYKK